MRGNCTFSSCPGVQLSQYIKNWWSNIYSEKLKLEKGKNAPHLLMGAGGREVGGEEKESCPCCPWFQDEEMEKMILVERSQELETSPFVGCD